MLMSELYREKKNAEEIYANEMRNHCDPDIHQETLSDLRVAFSREVGSFFNAYGLSDIKDFRIEPDNKLGCPVFIVTGASLTPYEPDKHGNDETHAFYNAAQNFLMNNTAVVMKRLMDKGERVIVHTKDPALLTGAVQAHPNFGNIRIVGGDLGQPDIHKNIYAALAEFASIRPVTEVRMALYQSFAQNNSQPFKPLHMEPVDNVETAACKRLRFIYNMAALGYDLLVNRGQNDLRIVSLSALAGQRATYGLIADAADKFMNELGWRTFHIEANASTAKPVTLYMVNPGITTACDVYRDHGVRTLVNGESIADGFPMSSRILANREPLPQLSSDVVGWVAETMLTTPYENNPNKRIPDEVKDCLYGGFKPDELNQKLKQAIQMDGECIDFGLPGILPEHIFAAATSYGKLPLLKKGDFRRISLTPPGQTF